MKKIIQLTIGICLLNACTKKADIGDFDVEAWLNDPKGCQGVRATMGKDLAELRPKLLGCYQKQIIKVLGDPEEQELYRRSQSYYIYYIDPAGDCLNAAQNPRKLEVRFTALGIANELNIRESVVSPKGPKGLL